MAKTGSQICFRHNELKSNSNVDIFCALDRSQIKGIRVRQINMQFCNLLSKLSDLVLLPLVGWMKKLINSMIEANDIEGPGSATIK